MKKVILFGMLITMCMGAVGINEAVAINVTASITADNSFGLYYGNEEEMFFVGSGNSWPTANTWEFDMGEEYTIYIAAWSDNMVAQGLLGELQIGTETFLTNTVDWEVALTNHDLGMGASPPSTDELLGKVVSANWNAVEYNIDHGSGPWGEISGISQEADWIWGSPLMPGSGQGEYQIFKLTSSVPEPTTWGLFVMGLIGLTGMRRKFKQ